MPHFRVSLTPSAIADLKIYRAFEQKALVGAIRQYLSEDANQESNRRKQLRSNPLAQWELRIGKYRVFYVLDADDVVKVVAVGHKEHNKLVIQGKEVEI